MPNKTVQEMRIAHKILAEFHFEHIELEKGYTNRYLRIDISSNEISVHPVTQQMKDLWIGGKGFDLWITFNEINKDTKWNSPENPICFSSGPLGGTSSFPGAGKTIVTAISPLTHNIMDCNVGGYFGPYLKFAGFDAMEIIGKAKEDVIILIDSEKNIVSIETAPDESIDSHILAEELTEMYADDELDKRNIAVVSAGRGAEHTWMGVLNFSFFDWRREIPRLKQAGRGGIGTVLRNKKIKAIVAKNKAVIPDWNVEKNKAAKNIIPENIPDTENIKDITTIDKIILKWNNDPEFVIEMMQDIQGKFKQISKTAIDRINKFTKTPKSYLYHIATFYKTFSLEQKGNTIIQVCVGTACHVKGSAKLIDAFERNLNIKCSQTTPDKKFSLEAVACLGACSIAPVVKIGNEIIGNVQVKDVEKILKNALNLNNIRGE